MLDRLVDWEVVRQGLVSVPGPSVHVSASCVASFAMARLEVVDEASPFLAYIVAMATEPQLGTPELLDLVQQICSRTSTDERTALRCWRLGLLTETLRAPESDPLYGAIRLGEFASIWDSVDIFPPFPQDSCATASDYLSACGYSQRRAELYEWSQVEARELLAIMSPRWMSTDA